MKELHTNLVGAKIKCSRGNNYKVVAVWLEERSTGTVGLKTLVVSDYGNSFILYLPDPDWSIMEVENVPFPHT